MPHDITTTVQRNSDLGNGNFLIEFEAPEATDGMRSGQFFMIGIPGSETLLRRPYSVCGLPGTFDDGGAGGVQVLYKVVGTGTGLLASLGIGARLTVLGPLGHGFGRSEAANERAVLVAGGIGSAPFPALIAELRSEGRPDPLMFYGGRGAGDLPLLDWFRQRTAEVTVTTDDGTLGRHGRVTEPLVELLDREDGEPLRLYACGPEAMLRVVAREATARAVPCELALEAHMACGFGVCLGCVVPTHGENGIRYERVCVDGPVMQASRLAW
jgi:dihydroorotate dehydrogenase electron transfer subunit